MRVIAVCVRWWEKLLNVITAVEESDGQDSFMVRRPIVIVTIVSSIDTIIIGLRTTEESCPLDSSTAVITLSNFSHHAWLYTTIMSSSFYYVTLSPFPACSCPIKLLSFLNHFGNLRLPSSVNDWHLQAHMYKYNWAVRRWCVHVRYRDTASKKTG